MFPLKLLYVTLNASTYVYWVWMLWRGTIIFSEKALEEGKFVAINSFVVYQLLHS